MPTAQQVFSRENVTVNIKRSTHKRACVIAASNEPSQTIGEFVEEAVMAAVEKGEAKLRRQFQRKAA